MGKCTKLRNLGEKGRSDVAESSKRLSQKQCTELREMLTYALPINVHTNLDHILSNVWKVSVAISSRVEVSPSLREIAAMTNGLKKLSKNEKAWSRVGMMSSRHANLADAARIYIQGDEVYPLPSWLIVKPYYLIYAQLVWLPYQDFFSPGIIAGYIKS